MADKVPKKFQGSWIVVVLLIIFCWPAALIYFFTSREPVYQYGAAPQGAYAPQYPPYQPPPQYGQPGYAPPQYGQQQPPQYGQPPQGYQQPPQQPPAPPTQEEEY